MKAYINVLRHEAWQWILVAVGLILISPDTVCAEIHLDMLKTQTETFTNVTVYNRSATDIFVRHNKGISNIKLSNLSPETLAILNAGGAKPATTADSMDALTADFSAENDPASTNSFALEAQMREQMMSGIAAFKALAPHINWTVVGIILGALFVFYLFICYCLKLICEKTGNKAGFLVWIPLLQYFPLFRAAGMSGWWFLGLFLPVINFITHILLFFKIVQARGKSVWVSIGLLLPLTNFISLLYLAFSDGNSSEDEGSGKISMSGGPLPVDA